MKFRSDFESAAGDQTEAAPLTVAGGKDLGNQSLGLGIALLLDIAAVLVFHCAGRCTELLEQHADPLQDIERLKAGDDTANPVLFGQRAIGIDADDGADIGWAEIAVDLQFLVGCQRRHRFRHGLVGTEHGKVRQIQSLGLNDGTGNCRCCRFKADAEEDDLPLRVVLGQLDRIQWRIDDADVGAAGFFFEQAGR